MKLTISYDTPDEQNAIEAGYAQVYNYEVTLSDGSANPITKSKFVSMQIKKQIQDSVTRTLIAKNQQDAQKATMTVTTVVVS